MGMVVVVIKIKMIPILMGLFKFSLLNSVISHKSGIALITQLFVEDSSYYEDASPISVIRVKSFLIYWE